ncbi:Flp pilus assembly protein CpaB [Novosphingobium sp. KCTC 2891]|uniref:Flp pilus assembly protein CpaB n=1 Tax=Novosphingobium sp. KCTC 2891 TaxID=2989730 RepID=UPI0022227CC2|nr:Flp pilus assembly protein CpaB [Novosphingobium sp. KCTC 2891]MCW1381595.1 Flp pilus assembly protein CpaB [Novosphingobium sp. KCTC 2891]
MNRNGAIALAVAAVIGLVAVYLLNVVLSGLESRKDADARNARLTRIVVASRPIAFGAPVNGINAVLVKWPAQAVPAGAFTSLEQLGKARVALQSIVPGEPLLAARLSGSDGRATLSVNLPPEKLAVAIPINDVTGVAGFVRPGDVVDVLLTRQIPGDGAGSNDKMTDVVMQAVPILAIDQVADPGKTDPTVARTATLEVDQSGAQKLTLARELGSLSLALRNITARPAAMGGTVTARDLSSSAPRIDRPVAVAAAAPAAAPRKAPAAVPLPPRPKGPMMTIVRKGKSTDYEVSHAF